jgi:hypothetical protein
LGIPSTLFGANYGIIELNAFTFVIIGITFGFIALLANQIEQEKTWAIWTMTVLSVLGIYSGYTQISFAFEKNPLYGLIGFSQSCLQYYALYLIHTAKRNSSSQVNNGQEKTSDQNPTSIVTSITSSVPTKPVPHSDSSYNLNDLGKLHELFKSGAITQEEFDQQKQKILSKAA